VSVKPSVVCAGYMPLDVIMTEDGLVARRAGGTAANVAAILSFLGWQASLAGQTGDDTAGMTLTADLASAGVDVTHVHRGSGVATPRLIHSVRRDGHSFRWSCPACRERLPRSRPLTVEGAQRLIAAVPRTSVYFFDRANAGTLALAEHYAEQGSVIVYEPSVPANAELLRRAASVANVIKHSDDRSVGGLEDLAITPRASQVRIVTHGAQGLELRVGAGRPRRLAALPARSVDSGGAGDWTTAGLLARAVGPTGLEQSRVVDALRFGQALAALSCAAPGARGLMGLTRRTVLRHVRRVQTDGGLPSRLRLNLASPPPPPAGACAVCLMPQAARTSDRRAA
jgi:fructokinase